MTRLFPLFALGGCLFLSEPPPGADPSPECVDTGCADGFTCDTFLDACAVTCNAVQPCSSGFRCDAGTCVELCDESDCSDNLACQPDGVGCLDSCDGNEDCAGDFVCCTSAKRANDKCDDVGACY